MREADPLAEIMTYLNLGDLPGAEAACKQALSQYPDNPRGWHLSGIVQAQQGRYEQAVECFQQAICLSPSQALYPFNLALACMALERTDEAIAAYRTAVELKPDFLEARNNLANALQREGNSEAAVTAFEELVARFPENANSHFNLANLLQDTGKFEPAVEHYLKTIQLDPNHSAARENLGRAYTDEGLLTAALEVWQTWLAHEPDNAVAKHMVASATGQTPPPRCDDDYVRETFNQDFAKNFDRQLARLNYQAPQLVSQALATAAPQQIHADLLDAGCGTGLCGPLVRDQAKRLTGVDLSADMLAQARKRNVYDELVEEELTLYLRQHQQAFDAILCADTLCYFGDLHDVLAAAGQSIRDQGWLVFTVEHASDTPDSGFQLKPHGRFCHTREYVQAVLQTTGFTVQDVLQTTLRKERGCPVVGLVFTAARSA